jgi:hypothetical protein
VESAEDRNVGPIRTTLRAHIGIEVAPRRTPVYAPTKNPNGSASTEMKRAGRAPARLASGLSRPRRPSSAACEVATRPLSGPKLVRAHVPMLIGERHLTMRSML